MKRIGKLEGIGDIVVRVVRTLISRGSEIGRRYLHQELIDPAIMGYSAAGVVAAIGNEVTEYAVGRRVAAMAPHAEYVAMNIDRDDGSWVTPMPDTVGFDAATFHPLVTGGLTWA